MGDAALGHLKTVTSERSVRMRVRYRRAMRPGTAVIVGGRVSNACAASASVAGSNAGGGAEGALVVTGCRSQAGGGLRRRMRLVPGRRQVPSGPRA